MEWSVGSRFSFASVQARVVRERRPLTVSSGTPRQTSKTEAKPRGLVMLRHAFMVGIALFGLAGASGCCCCGGSCQQACGSSCGSSCGQTCNSPCQSSCNSGCQQSCGSCSQPSCGSCCQGSCGGGTCCLNPFQKLWGCDRQFCGCGCGCSDEVYEGDWRSFPPRCEPCDCCGNWVGPGEPTAPYQMPPRVGSIAPVPYEPTLAPSGDTLQPDNTVPSDNAAPSGPMSAAPSNRQARGY